MKRSTVLAAFLLASATLFGPAALPATAQPAKPQPAGAVSVAAPAQQAGGITVSVHRDEIGAGFHIARRISALDPKGSRSGFTRASVDIAFAEAGRRYNVIIFNLDQGYNHRLDNIKVYATVNWDGIFYGLRVAEAGDFTNTGHGGYDNWAYFGWFDRGGQTVFFRRP